jgi:ABC-type lipoprotein release transport system permease subunit
MKLIWSSLRFYAKSHLGTVLGVAVASAILVGALAIGDCVRESLRDLALARIGKTTFALASADRFFRSALAEDLQPAAAVLQLPGTAATPDDSARANHVQILGVDEKFWSLAQTSVSEKIPPDSVVLNTALAQQLGVKPGETVILHVQKPSLLSQEAPISPREDVSTGLRLTVSAVVTDAEFGRFGLQANQASPLNAFVPLSWLQAKVDQPGRANLLLTAGPEPELKKHWTLADAALEWRDLPGGLELRSGRVFIDPAIVAAAGPGHELVLTYFVNELRDRSKNTPYSMVTAAGAPLIPSDLSDHEIIISPWLAEDLQSKAGDEIQLSYFVLSASHRLEEKTNTFKVRSIAPMDGPTADRTLMPDFPGIAKAEKTENWDAGFTIDMKKIRPKDEKYWKEFRGTPKAFITLAAGREMWGNRFGDVTAIRFPAGTSRQAVESEMLAKLDPASLGLTFLPVREQALAASSQSEDFGGLFIGFSFFLVVAALILLAMLFHFGLERRATEMGLLLAVGWRPKQVRRLLILEGVALAAAGSVLGVAGGILYARAILWGLTTLWRAAVAESPLQFHVTAQTLAIGCLSGILVSTLVIAMAVRSRAKRSARELLNQGNELELVPGATKRRRSWADWIAVISGLGAVACVAVPLAKHNTSDVESFFSAGGLLLVCFVAVAAVWFRSLVKPAATRPLTLWNLGVRSCTRRRNRSVAIIALLASGAFLIAAVEANKLDATRDSGKRSSGTGGFAFIGESSLPIVQDLNSKAGREFFSLDQDSLKDAAAVPLRVHDGDDASCLNLNRAQTPRLLGVDPQELSKRGAFTFSEVSDSSFRDHPWLLLTNGGEEIPAVGDEATITWALHKKIGDIVNYTDEHGHSFKVRLVGAVANSILQGSLIIAEAEFIKKFPGEAGYRMFLVDAPPNEAAAVSATLTRGLRDRGLELTSAAARLNAFNAVQNTYLDTFQVLGGLGLLLGSAGLGVVVLRNVLERRGELAVLAAVGYKPRTLRQLIVTEHAVLQVLGLSLGLGAAVLALLPVLLSPSAQISYVSLAATLGLVFLSGLFWTWAAARLALRGEFLPALRNE